MADPTADRPHMPGYGISEDLDGVLSWAWAEERLAVSRNYWVASVRPDGRPHVMPVWAVWREGLLYFSTARTSTKAWNLYADSRCTVTTETAENAVILEGEASVVEGAEMLQPVWDAYRAKYDWDLSGESMFAVRPRLAFGFIESAEQFSKAATRWRFG